MDGSVISLPMLPRKTMFWEDATDAAVLQERREGLQVKNI